MTTAFWRRACILLLVVLCLGLDAGRSPSDLLPPGEARLARAAHDQVAAPAKDFAALAEALSRHEPATGDEGPGGVAALRAEQASLLADLGRPARSAAPAGLLANLAALRWARAPPLLS